MIELTRLNGNPMLLNSDLIKTAEASPDTMLTLINGEKLIVRESCVDVIERVLAYRARRLAAVSRQLPSLQDLDKMTSLNSLNTGGQSDLPLSWKPASRRWSAEASHGDCADDVWRSVPWIKRVLAECCWPLRGSWPDC